MDKGRETLMWPHPRKQHQGAQCLQDHDYVGHNWPRDSILNLLKWEEQ